VPAVTVNAVPEPVVLVLALSVIVGALEPV
jgi:hypothetical protein